jgi:outer membrane protein assembly factor BamA
MHFFYILILFFYSITLSADTTLKISAQSDDYEKMIDQAVMKPFLLEKLTCDSDVYLAESEFRYLTELKDGTNVTPGDLKRAISYLLKKNKFETITLTIQDTGKAKKLHCILDSFWSFKRLKIHGILVGKDTYRHYYLMESGDTFDMEKHELSVERILEAFKADGYFNATVKSTFNKDHKNKNVKVDIDLNKGGRFTINDISCTVKKEDALNESDFANIRSDFHKQLCTQLRNTPYHKAMLTTETTALKKLLETRGFIDVDIELQEKINHEEQTVSLAFAIELNHKKEFIFVGNQFYSSAELLDQVMQFGRSAWMLPASMLCQELAHAYHTKGFWKSDVSALEKKDQFIFTITEGPRFAVSSVVLKYAHSFDNHVLIQNSFSAFIKAKYFDQDLLDASLEALSMWYLKEGYLDMKIVKQEYLQLNADHTQLIITIDEGQRSFITSIVVEPFTELANQGPFLEFQRQNKSVPFDVQQLAHQRKWLINYFLNKGYAHAEAKPEVHRESGNVAITWKVNVSENKIRFGKTVVVGSTRLPFECVLREMAYKQGDIWNKNALRRSFSNLKNLEVFESIHLHPDQADPLNEEKPIIVKVQEDDPFELRLRGGLELQNFVQRYIYEGIAYRAGGAFIIKSPFDVGDQLRFDAEVARYHREVEVKYQRPWLLDMPLKTTMAGYANSYSEPGFIGNPINIYVLTQNGIIGGISREYEPFEFGITAGFEWMKTTIPDCSERITNLISSISHAIDFNPLLLSQTVPFFQIEPTVILDYLDQKLNPTNGSFTLFSLKGMFPMRCSNINTNFVKATLEQSLFMPIKSVVAALRLRAGHIFGRKFSSIMPNERFYLGGANSLRGYETDTAGPLGTFLDCDGQPQFAPQGGRTMMNVNAELRIPVYQSIGAVIFQDVGALSNCGFADLKPQNLLASTGFGVRFNTPLGPLRFDIGWKWDSQVPWSRNFAWFLAFGQAF